MQIPRVTVPWTILSLLLSLLVGLIASYTLEARWGGPLAMTVTMAILIYIGRIVPERANGRRRVRKAEIE